MLDLHNGAGRARDTGPQVSTLLGHRASDGRTLHLALSIHDHASVVLEVEVHAVLSADVLLLTDHDSRHDLLDGGDHHGARSSRGDPVQATLDAVHSHDVQVLGASVVGAVHDRTAGQTKGDPVLVARGTCTTALAHGFG